MGAIVAAVPTLVKGVTDLFNLFGGKESLTPEEQAKVIADAREDVYNQRIKQLTDERSGTSTSPGKLAAGMTIEQQKQRGGASVVTPPGATEVGYSGSAVLDRYQDLTGGAPGKGFYLPGLPAEPGGSKDMWTVVGIGVAILLIVKIFSK